MGVTKIRIKLLYFYEALVLVFASCLMGVIIGLLVGYTMCLQTALLLQSQLTFYFPVSQFIIILLVSIICAFGSTFVPTTAITNKQIAAIFRLV